MKFKFKNLIAFTLSEMMIVLLIVSVISAATIPTITQQKQKPYNVAENNSTGTENWKKDNFSGIFSAFSLEDSNHSIVVGKDTKNSASVQRLYGAVPALFLMKTFNGTNKSSDKGQMMLYQKSKYVGSIGFDKDNISMGYGVLYNSGISYGNVAMGYYAMSTSKAIHIDNIAIGAMSMYGVVTPMENISIGSYAGYYSNRRSSSVSIGAYASANSPSVSSFGTRSSAIYPQIEDNIDIGFAAGVMGYATVNSSQKVLTQNVSIGYYSGNTSNALIRSSRNEASCVPRNKISIGSFAGRGFTNADTISIGYLAGAADEDVASVLYNTNDETHDNDISIGYYSHTTKYKSTSDKGIYSQNIYIGSYAGLNSQNAISQDIGIGSYTMTSNWNTSYNAPRIAIGYYSASNDGGVSLGAYAGTNVHSKTYSINIGRWAGYGNWNQVVSARSIYIGRYASYLNPIINDGINIGNEAGRYASVNGTYRDSSGMQIGYGTFSRSIYTRMILPYASKSIGSDTNFADNGGNFGSMVIGPGYGYPGGPSFNNTILVLYAANIYARSTNFSPFYSDKRSKENIVKAKYGIDQMRYINTYTYNFNFDETEKPPRVGIIAQEVQKYIPEAIVKSADGTLTVDFDWILYPLANAIKDVDKTLTQLKKDLIAQAKDLISLEKRVDKLDKKVSKTLGKQEKMQAKLDKTKDIVNNMETK